MSLWMWPVEGTTRHDLQVTRPLPTFRVVGCLNGHEMNSWPPPAGPPSERICQFIGDKQAVFWAGQANILDE